MVEKEITVTVGTTPWNCAEVPGLVASSATSSERRVIGPMEILTVPEHVIQSSDLAALLLHLTFEALDLW